MAGPIEAKLFVSTTGTDSDWVVKLVDVYPDDYPDPNPNPAGIKMGGYQQLVRGDVMRGKFRNSFERPEPFEPGKPTQIKFVLPDVCHTFRSGHRIMIQVQSSWFPLVDTQSADVHRHLHRERYRLPQSHTARLPHARACLFVERDGAVIRRGRVSARFLAAGTLDYKLAVGWWTRLADLVVLFSCQ